MLLHLLAAADSWANAVAAAATLAGCAIGSAGAVFAAGITRAAGATTAEKAIAAYNLSSLSDTSDQALKVSYFITDSTGGLEAGDNAFMIEGFASAPMATNQQPLSFGTAGKLEYDPLNFELPAA